MRSRLKLIVVIVVVALISFVVDLDAKSCRSDETCKKEKLKGCCLEPGGLDGVCVKDCDKECEEQKGADAECGGVKERRCESAEECAQAKGVKYGKNIGIPAGCCFETNNEGAQNGICTTSCRACETMLERANISSSRCNRLPSNPEKASEISSEAAGERTGGGKSLAGSKSSGMVLSGAADVRTTPLDAVVVIVALGVCFRCGSGR